MRVDYYEVRFMDIIIFSGQSNMQGQSDCLSENAVVEGASEYKYLTDEFVPLKNPVGENITFEKCAGYVPDVGVNLGQWLSDHVLGSACYNHTNLVPSFCRRYVADTGEDVVAVHAAKGSTDIAYWLPGGAGYETLTAKASAAIEKARSTASVGRVYFVWLQGESDAILNVSKDEYKKRITHLCNSLRADLGVEKFGIIRVGRFTNDQRDLEIINAQDEVCTENDNFLMLTDIATTLNEIPEYMHPAIAGHYSAAGLERLGDAAAETLAAHRNTTKE